jgi:hypothetical protein
MPYSMTAVRHFEQNDYSHVSKKYSSGQAQI